jgi:hypothetical protein
MSSNLNKTAKIINNYLSNFKDAQGNQPCQLKLAFMIENYCDEYCKSTRK